MSAPCAGNPWPYNAGSELQALLNNGVRFSLQLRPDGTFQAYFGDYISGWCTQRNLATLEWACIWVKSMAERSSRAPAAPEGMSHDAAL
jgi:hypothetical protein